MLLLAIIRAVHNLAYEISGRIETDCLGKGNIEIIVMGVLWIIFYILLLKNYHKKNETGSEKTSSETHFSFLLSKQEKDEKEIEKLKSDLEVVEDAFQNKIIDEETYNRDKEEILSILRKKEMRKEIDELSERMNEIISEIDNSEEFKE